MATVIFVVSVISILIAVYERATVLNCAIGDIKSIVSPSKPFCNAILLIDSDGYARLGEWKEHISREASLFWKPETLILAKTLGILKKDAWKIDVSVFVANETFVFWGEDDSYRYQVVPVTYSGQLPKSYATAPGNHIIWKKYKKIDIELARWKKKMEE